MTTTREQELRGLARQVISAWQALDLEELRRIVAPDVRTTHKNRGVCAGDREAMLARIVEMHKAFPDRTIQETGRWAVTGDTIMRETVWQGTAAFDIEGFWGENEHRRLEVLSVMTFRGGQLVEWSDYG